MGNRAMDLNDPAQVAALTAHYEAGFVRSVGQPPTRP
jgi:hypothetical protein